MTECESPITKRIFSSIFLLVIFYYFMLGSHLLHNTKFGFLYVGRKIKNGMTEGCGAGIFIQSLFE
jgi:hypothetical protein